MYKFEVGDKVKLSKKHSEYCNAEHDKYINKIGVVFSISSCYSSLPISVMFDDADIWHHSISCLEKVYEGFNPEDIINKAFGV